MALLQIIAFLVVLGFIGLYVTIGEPILDAMANTSSVVPSGGNAELIIFGTPIVLVVFGLWMLTRGDNELGYRR